MRLSRADRTKQARDNYLRARENVKFGEPPITSSHKRQSGIGKGDFPRVVNKKIYDMNYNLIRWKSNKEKKHADAS